MTYIVGDLIDPKEETDEEFNDFNFAYDRMNEIANEKENFVVGLWEKDNDYAEYIAVNGEVFKSE